MKQQKDNQDEGLKGNEKIEEAILALQHESTQEQLAHTLTVIRRRMRENGQALASASVVRISSMVLPPLSLTYKF